MEKITIQGHSTRGKDVIKILESLGGLNTQKYNGNDSALPVDIINNIINKI